MIARELQAVRSMYHPLTMDQIRRAAPSAFATQPFHEMSSRYTFIPTSDVIEGMIQAGYLPFAVSQSQARSADRREYTKHMIRFRPVDVKVTRRTGAAPEIVVINGHDGSSLYKFIGGLIRFICENGLIIADSTIASIAVRHIGNVIESAAKAAAEVVERMPLVLDAVDKWDAIELTKTEQGFFAEAARDIRFADAEGKFDQSITVEKLLAPRRSEDSGNSLWTVFNRVQENVMKGGIRTYDADAGRRNKTRAVKSIDKDVQLNRALWTLAEKMAELKNA